MPFEETHVMDQRQRFVHDAHAQLKTFSDLCADYGISRKTGYKWLERWITEGRDGLHDRTSRPRNSPVATPKDVVDTIVEVRKRYTDFGPKKVEWAPGTDPAGSGAAFTYDDPQHPAAAWSGAPAQTARSTLAPRPAADRGAFAQCDLDDGLQGPIPNTRRLLLLSAHRSGHALTISAGCHGLSDVSIGGVRPVFTRLFREFGLPERIRSDNGAPFASNALGRLSQLSVWFVTFGITPELIEPVSPYQNGKHENMHLVLKRQATRPPRAICELNRRCSTHFAATIIACGRMKPSTASCRAICAVHHHGRFRGASTPLPTRITLKCGVSHVTAVLDGLATG